jgi:hypothetical protein
VNLLLHMLQRDRPYFFPLQVKRRSRLSLTGELVVERGMKKVWGNKVY